MENSQDSGLQINWLTAKNPKRAGSKAHARAKAYWKAKTTAEYLALGGTPADLKYDASKGFLEVLDPQK